MRLHVIDGTYELFRAHFSPRPGQLDTSGRDVKATVGVVASLIGLLTDPIEAVSHIAVAFDNPIESFRNELFDGYKTGAGIPEELAAQFDLVEEAVAALGIVVWSMDRYEADDALATAAKRYGAHVEQVRIMTPDKDLGQCIEGRKVVQVDRMRAKEIDEDALRARRGIAPASIPDWLALVGDTADGIPGIPGFGEKSAAAVLAHYHHLEAIPARASDWAVPIRGAKRLADALAERRGDALLYRTLATLVADVPLPESFDDLAVAGPRPQWTAVCERLGAEGLAARGRAITPRRTPAGSR